MTSHKFQGEPALGCWYTEEEISAAVDAIRRSMEPDVGFRAAQDVQAFELAFSRYIGVDHAVAVNGAGTALDMLVRSLDPQPDDEIVSCAINFHGTHLAILGSGAKLVLCEPDPVTLNIDAADLDRRITPNTRAVMVTHMNGMSADMDAVEKVVGAHRHRRHGAIRIFGDAARSCGAGYRGGKVGSRGWATAFSFQSKKNMTTLGEGGMITTNDAELAAGLRRMRAFGEGVAWGTNYKMTKPQAAVGQVQLRRLDAMNARRRELAVARTKALTETRLVLPDHGPDYDHVYLLYTLLVPEDADAAIRDSIMADLKKRNVGSVIANPPTYVSNTFVAERTAGQRLPLADAVGRRVFCPALHPLMTDADNAHVSEAIFEAAARHLS